MVVRKSGTTWYEIQMQHNLILMWVQYINIVLSPYLNHILCVWNILLNSRILDVFWTHHPSLALYAYMFAHRHRHVCQKRHHVRISDGSNKRAKRKHRVWPPVGPFAGRHARLQLQRTQNYLFRTSKSPHSVEVQVRKKSNIPFCQTESVNIFEDTAFSKSQATALPSAGTVVLNEGIVSLHHSTSYHS